MRVGIIGCGKQADAHAAQIQIIPGCTIVGVCDTELLMAKQLAERYKVSYYFDTVEELLSIAQPEVVHIITPPQNHYPISKLCLEARCNVMLEKPFTLNFEEARALVDLAVVGDLKITVGHHHHFSAAAKDMRRLVRSGFLGEQVVHLESMFGYDFSDERYAKALLGDKTHWVRRLPGNLLHNIISHPLSKIAEFVKGNQPKVVALGSTSSFLKRIGEHEIIDELRVIIVDDASPTTAYLTFSSQISPLHHQLRLYGSKNSLIVDYEAQTLFKAAGNTYKSYLKQILPPLLYGKQFVGQSAKNIKRFVTHALNYEGGRRQLIELFYDSIRKKSDEPIPHREILLTRWLMDEIFRQIARNDDLV